MLRENTCPIASGDYSTPVSQRSYIGITICIKPKTQASVNVTGKHGSVQLKTLTLILSMRAWLSVNNNAGWNGQNGWYGNTIVAHPLLKGAMAASPNCTITGEV